ncbi:MAG: hypothetical protein ACT4NV_19890 [Rhodoferax sp.]
MQLPSIDRTPQVRPPGAVEVVASGANRVLPVAPVNPPTPPHALSETAVEPVPSVINMVKPTPTQAPTPNDPVYSQRSDPMVRHSEAATAPKDWTIHRPEAEPQKEEIPPPKPMSQVLMDHIRTLWSAGSSAIHIEHASNQLQAARTQPAPVDVPGELARQVLTFKPSEVNKTEEI